MLLFKPLNQNFRELLNSSPDTSSEASLSKKDCVLATV